MIFRLRPGLFRTLGAQIPPRRQRQQPVRFGIPDADRKHPGTPAARIYARQVLKLEPVPERLGQLAVEPAQIIPQVVQGRGGQRIGQQCDARGVFADPVPRRRGPPVQFALIIPFCRLYFGLAALQGRYLFIGPLFRRG